MLWGRWLGPVMCCLAALPLRVLAAQPSAPATQPGVVPIVQLTVQPARFLDHDNCVGNLLLRELQRQAVLIAARDELGIGTRDMVLREPFATHGANGVATVLFESRIWRGESAQICLARFDGTQPANPYALADVQVDRTENACQKWVTFKIPKDAMVDYPAFVTQCEAESRGEYLQTLLGEKVLGGRAANPIQWVDAGPADAVALHRMRAMDVFSQYLAVRRLHDQIRTDGASTDRLTALVRGYANLAALTGSQWSQANKAFIARSLLYAERLVVHEHNSSASLRARAYARAFAGLHAAGLMDLNTVAQREDSGEKSGSVEPDWVPIIRAWCQYDLAAAERAVAVGSWDTRPLAEYVAAVVAGDGYVATARQAALDRVLYHFPEMFVLAPQVAYVIYGNSQLPDQVVNEVPVVLVNSLKGAAELSAPTNAIVRRIKPGNDAFKQLAALRDQLNGMALKSPGDSAEPSFGVLADLIEQQEMVGLVRIAASAAVSNFNNNGQPNELQAKITAAKPIWSAHPWGPYVESLVLGNNQAERQTQLLNKIKDRNLGAWIDEAFTHLQAQSRETNSLEATWRKTEDLLADTLVTDYSAREASQRAVHGDVQGYLFALCKSSPHSATLLGAWMRSVSLDRVLKEKPLYERALNRVETEFADRPAVLHAACDWSDTRGDFERSLGLLNKLDQLEPSSDNCAHTSRILHHLGRKEEAISRVMRAIQMADDSTPTYDMLHQAADYLIDDHQFEAAIALIQQSAANSPQLPQVYQMLARCYEAMGQIDDADECFRQQDNAFPAYIGQHYLWARRLGRHDANDLRRKAAAYVRQPSDSVNLAPAVAVATDLDQKAMSLLRQSGSTDSLDLAQLVVLATKLNNKQNRAWAIGQFGAGYDVDRPFGLAFKALVEARNVEPAVAAFDAWAARQLDDELAVDWYSYSGRYLVAAGHAEQGRAYLIRAIHQRARERESYYFAWRELQKMGDDPKSLLAEAATRPS